VPRLIPDLLQGDESVLFLLYLRLLLLHILLLFEEQEALLFDPRIVAETSLWGNHLYYYIGLSSPAFNMQTQIWGIPIGRK
jgi:hypothetical protein